MIGVAQQPLFTQKHYEHLERELARSYSPNKDEIVRALCAIFERDNPKFKRRVFAANIMKEKT